MVPFTVKDGSLAEVTVDFAGRRTGRNVRITHQNFMYGSAGPPGRDATPIVHDRPKRSVSVFVAKFRVTESGAGTGAAKRRLYDRSKVPASGQAAPRFLQHNWLSRIPAWNAYEKERYMRYSAVPTSTEWKRHLRASTAAPTVTCAPLMHRAVIIEMHRLSWGHTRNWTVITVIRDSSEAALLSGRTENVRNRDFVRICAAYIIQTVGCVSLNSKCVKIIVRHFMWLIRRDRIFIVMNNLEF